MKVLSSFMCLFAVVCANTNSTAPVPEEGRPAAPPGHAAPPGQLAPGQAVPAPSAADSTACARSKILAQSIGVNILIQMQEQARTTEIMMTLMTNPVNPHQFQVAKANLLSVVNDGIGLREANQLITPDGNPATEGLAIVANAQLTELRKSSSLTGNPAQDIPVLQSLQQDFAGGIMQNMKNQQAALAGCP